MSEITPLEKYKGKQFINLIKSELESNEELNDIRVSLDKSDDSFVVKVSMKYKDKALFITGSTGKEDLFKDPHSLRSELYGEVKRLKSKVETKKNTFYIY